METRSPTVYTCTSKPYNKEFCQENNYVKDTGYANLVYKGTIDDMSHNRCGYAAATTVGNYAIFGTGGNDNSTVDVYTHSLTHTTTGSAGKRSHQRSAATVGNYALFGGDDGTTIVEAYELQFV